MGRRSRRRPVPGPGCPVHEPKVSPGAAEPGRPGANDSRRPRRAQGIGDGRGFTAAMKILVIGLDCAAPELLFGDERLTSIRRLMEWGCYGRLESVIPPITVPAWMCMSTSQDPGSLGVYGFRNRMDHSYNGLGFVNSRSIQENATWDKVAREGKRANIIGV